MVSAQHLLLGSSKMTNMLPPRKSLWKWSAEDLVTDVRWSPGFHSTVSTVFFSAPILSPGPCGAGFLIQPENGLAKKTNKQKIERICEGLLPEWDHHKKIKVMKLNYINVAACLWSEYYISKDWNNLDCFCSHSNHTSLAFTIMDSGKWVTANLLRLSV